MKALLLSLAVPSPKPMVAATSAQAAETNLLVVDEVASMEDEMEASRAEATLVRVVVDEVAPAVVEVELSHRLKQL